MYSRLAITLGVFLIATTPAWGRSAGPPPDRSGVNGITCTACHLGNPVNSPGGSVTLDGLPANWTAGAVYTLRVTISRPASARYGFQLTAVDSNSRSIGNFVVGADGRTSIQIADVNGAPLEHIQHNSLGSAAGGSNVFEFQYRAPAGPAGTIRFNVAANAANNSGNSQGDFIYTLERILAPGGATSRAFSLTDRGGSSAVTAGAGGLTVGHARIVAGAGSVMPAGLGILSYRQGTTLISETSLAASTPIRSGRVWVESAGGTNTGVAIANPNAQDVTVAVYFTDAAGGAFGRKNLTIPGNGQVAAFVDQTLFSSGAGPFQTSIDVARTLTFDASLPVSVTAIRWFANERAEILMSTLPVTELSAPVGQAAYVPYLAIGGAWNAQVVLVNPSDDVLTGTVSFFGSGSGSAPAETLTLTVDGQTGTSFAYSIPSRSAVRMRVTGGASLQNGSVRVTPATSSRTPSAFALLSMRPGTITMTETIVAASSASSVFRTFVDNSGDFARAEPRSGQSGVSITNTSSTPATVTFELSNLDGSAAPFTGSVTVPGFGQFNGFVGQLPGFASLPANIQGVLRLAADQRVVVTGLRGRYNDRSGGANLVLSAMAAVDEAAPASSSDLTIPHLADAAGYTTQLVVFGRSSGQASAGTIRFFAPDGQPLTLSLQ